MAGSNWGVEAWKLLSLSPMAEGNWKHGSRWQVLSHPFTGFHMGFECLSWGTLGKEIISFQLGRFEIKKRNLKPVVSLIMVWTKQMQKQRILFVQKDVLYIVKKRKKSSSIPTDMMFLFSSFSWVPQKYVSGLITVLADTCMFCSFTARLLFLLTDFSDTFLLSPPPPILSRGLVNRINHVLYRIVEYKVAKVSSADSFLQSFQI